MRFGKISLAAATAAALITAPVMAQAVAPVSKAATSANVKRASADRKNESKVEGGSGIIIAILAAAAVIAGIIIAADGSENTPTSP